MDKQFFIIIGRSGSGKGTQALLLKEYLEKKGARDVLHITTGGSFRAFVEGDSYAAGLARKINETAGLQPEFLAIWNWSNIFINSLKGDETVILDGAPRKPFEVSVLSGAMSFFGYKPATVVYIDVSETWACEKLASRGRADDTSKEDQERKMQWFADYVLPCVAMYKEDTRHTFIHVNGEQTIDDVFKEIVAKLELSST
jgi:adenylate kinase family enzyme